MTAYGGPNTTGLASDPYEITFTVIADKALRVPAATVESEKPSATFRVAPNLFREHTSLLFTPAEGGEVSVAVLSPQGVLLQRVYEGVVEAGKPYAWLGRLTPNRCRPVCTSAGYGRVRRYSIRK